MVLRPKAFDQAAMITTVTDGAASDVSEFLTAAALAALDPTDPFGTEMVSNLSTVCVLHGLLARLDVADAQKRLGALDGVVAVLDTPTLTYLVGGSTMREPVERMIAAAVASGVRVVALEHYLDELQGVVEAAGRVAATQETELSSSEARQAYIALAEGDDLLIRYYELREEGILGSWVEFEKHVAALRSRLTALGVVVRPHGNSDREQVAACEVALREVLNENGWRGRPRSRDAIERDSETLSMALRHRRHFRRDKPEIKWPGLIVLTSDRRLARAYAQLDASEQLPLVLRLGQFTLMLARIRPVPEVGELTEAAGRMLTRDVAEAVAMHYPPAIACQLATTLSGAGGATDVRVAQFRDLHDVLQTADTQDLLGEVVRRRAMRTRESTLHTSRLMESQLAAHGDAAEAARADRERAAALQQETQRRESRQEQENQNLRERLAAAMTPEDLETLRRRTGVRSFLGAMNLAAVVISLLVSIPAAVVIAVAGILLWAQTGDWVSAPAIRLRSAAVGIAADSVGLLAFLWAMLSHR